MASWNSLYLSCDPALAPDTLADNLQTTLAHLDYKPYDAFGPIPGIAYPHTLKLFIAPLAGGWRRVLVDATQPDDIAITAARLSKLGLCLRATLDGKEAALTAYAVGEETDVETALIPHLREGKTADDLNRALNNVGLLPPVDDAQKVAVVPMDALPDDVKDMAQDVNPKQAQKMFDKIAGRLVNRQQSDAAKGLLGGDAPDWNSGGGARIRAVMACLTVPDDWRMPDFVTLRTAYQLHARKRRKPDARLYPGDAEDMAAVPDALDYVPVYGGKDG